jgi:hypothetical protein
MANNVDLSLVITAKSYDDVKLFDLLESIGKQSFPTSNLEIRVITEGTSESAKAIGINRSKGKVICILASDNILDDKNFLNLGYSTAMEHYAAQPTYYSHRLSDNILTRYFALIGGNDPVPFFLGKNDKLPHYEHFRDIDLKNKTTGDNGYFVRTEFIKQTDLDNYYHIDNSQEIAPPINFNSSIVHNTGGNLFSFFIKRYKYALKLGFNKNTRWRMVTRKDIPKLLWFILASVTVVYPLRTSIRGYKAIKDKAWFLHPVVCILSLLTYAILTFHLSLRWLFVRAEERA